MTLKGDLKMSTYAISSKQENVWVKTKAKTLQGAKKVATEYFADGWIDDTLYVGEKSFFGCYKTVATKIHNRKKYSEWLT